MAHLGVYDAVTAPRATRIPYHPDNKLGDIAPENTLSSVARCRRRRPTRAARPRDRCGEESRSAGAREG